MPCSEDQCKRGERTMYTLLKPWKSFSLFLFFFYWYQHLRFSDESGVEDLLFFSFSFLSQQQANLAKNPSFDSDELLAVWCFIEDAGAGIDGGGCTCTCAGDCGNCWTGCCGADCRDA